MAQVADEISNMISFKRKRKKGWEPDMRGLCWNKMNASTICRLQFGNVGMLKPVKHDPRYSFIGRSKPGMLNICITTVCFHNLNLLLKMLQPSLH